MSGDPQKRAKGPWFRVQSRLPTHEKYAPLSDAAFRLAITAGCWCSDRMTDGFIPKSMVPELPHAPRGKALKNALVELTKETGKLSPIWHDRGDEYELHDYLEWNISRSDWETKVNAAAAGGKAKAAKQPTKTLPHGTPHGIADGTETACQTDATCSAKTLPSPLPDLDHDQDPDLPEGVRSKDQNHHRNQEERGGGDGSERRFPPTKADVPCPIDLKLDENQRANLEMNLGMQPWQIDALQAEFVSSWISSGNQGKPLVAWRKCLSTAIAQKWNRGYRPQKPAIDTSARKELDDCPAF